MRSSIPTFLCQNHDFQYWYLFSGLRLTTAVGLPNNSTMTCFPLRLVFASLMFLLAVPSGALPTIPNITTLSGPTNSSLNRILSHCYTPDSQGTPGIKPVDPKDCTDALSVLVRTQDFTKRFRFSRNPRAQAVKVPIGWQKTADSDCRIVVTCMNDRDTSVFRLADVAQVARRIIDHCVDEPDPHGRYPLLQWGGVSGISEAETFYVAVAKPIRPELGLGDRNLSVIETG